MGYIVECDPIGHRNHPSSRACAPAGAQEGIMAQSGQTLNRRSQPVEKKAAARAAALLPLLLSLAPRT